MIDVIDKLNKPSNQNCPLLIRAVKNKSEMSQSISSEICNLRNNYLDALQSRASSSDKILSKIASEDSDLIILGETHNSYYIDEYPKLVTTLKKANPNIDCLFVEFPSNMDSQVAALTRKDLDHDIELSLFQFKDLYQQAAMLGIKIIPVDREVENIVHADFNERKQMSTVSGMNDRDEIMASNIKKNLSSKKCTKAISIDGRNHIVKVEDDRISLQERLQRSGLKITSVLMQTASSKDGAWLWKSCKQNPHSPDSEIGVKIEAAPNQVTYEQSGGRWEHFDYMILSPEKEYKKLNFR